MVICPKCGAQLPDGTAQCPACGLVLSTFNPQQQQQQRYQQYQYQQPVQTVDPKDHTAEFDAKDISENKVMAMAAYILGVVGIIIALLAANKSEYAGFHVRQSLKLSIVETLIALASVFLFFTLIVPLAGIICSGICFVLRVIMFFNVCNGKAKEVPIISSLGFLK
jgi:uncharacterized membrane protein